MGHQKIGRCVHFDGLPFRDDERGKKCLAGVDYRAHVGGDDAGWMARVPCLPDSSLRKHDEVVPCPHYRDPTQLEIDADEAEHQAHMAMFRTVMQGVAPWRKKHKGHGFTEIIECPACKGRLHLSIAAYNGHVHGYCETDGCARWME